MPYLLAVVAFILALIGRQADSTYIGGLATGAAIVLLITAAILWWQERDWWR